MVVGGRWWLLVAVGGWWWPLVVGGGRWWLVALVARSAPQAHSGNGLTKVPVHRAPRDDARGASTASVLAGKRIFPTDGVDSLFARELNY
jgi:hypothetical protein